MLGVMTIKPRKGRSHPCTSSQVVGYTPSEEQTGPALFVISAPISIVPGGAYLVAAFVFRRFDLDENEPAPRPRTESQPSRADPPQVSAVPGVCGVER